MQPGMDLVPGIAVFLLFWALMIALAIAALFSLRGKRMSDIAQVLWAAFIVLVPIAGPISYFIVGPGER